MSSLTSTPWFSHAHPALRRSLALEQGVLWEHVALTPSPQLPPYLIAQLLEVAEELSHAPHPSLTPVAILNKTHAPSLLFKAPPHEHLAQLALLAQAQGRELPLALTGAIILEVARALTHLHAHGFTHGGVRADHLTLSYQGEVHLNGWLEGALSQLTPEGARYGRGPEADLRALTRLFEQSLGDPSALLNAQSTPASAPLEDLPRPLASWLTEALAQPKQGLAFVTSLERALTESIGQLFDQGARARWLKRLSAERLTHWSAALSGHPELLPQLIPQLTPTLAPQLKATAPAQPAPAQPAPAQPAPAQPAPAQPAPAQPAPAQPAPTQDEGPLLKRLDAKLKRLEERLQTRFTPEPPPQLKARVALLWNDTISAEGYFDPERPITLGGEGATLNAPQLTNEPLWTLCAPTSRGVVISPPQDAQGWCSTQEGAPREPWGAEGGPHPLSPTGRALIRFGELAVFVELLYVTPHYRRFTLPIPNINPLSFISISIAALAHLSLLVSAYAFKDFTIRQPGTMPVSRFVEVMIEEQPDKEIEEPEEELEEEAEAPSEEEVEASDDAPTLPPPPDEAPAPREEARRVAQERFGKGEAAVKALASFLSGETKGSGLSLGDASAALGSGSGALALGSAFGDAGGDISLGGGGGGGGLDTSTGLGGAKRAGQLKAKRRTRKVRGRVKTLKSTMRARGSNGLSKEQVLKAIRKSQVRIAACYERQLLKSPNISGMLTLSWEITPQGKVTSAREVTSSLGSPALTSCVMKVIKRARFPSSKGKTKVKYPFVFQQG